MSRGNIVAQHSWEESIPLFERAENVLGSASSQAALAACRATQMLISLCDYSKARHEVARIEREYSLVMDPATEAELSRIKGWLDYYEGNYSLAEQALTECVAIANEYGNEYLGESAQHFLGRVYADWSQVVGDGLHTDLVIKADAAFERALDIHSKHGTDSQAAFDLLRKAQLLHIEGKEGVDTHRLRDEARAKFGEDDAVTHVDLEEARVALDDYDVRGSKRIAEKVLEFWSDRKYAKGMSDALHILGEANLDEVRGGNRKLVQALEVCIAALCIYPFENHLRNRELWNMVNEIASSLKDKKGEDTYEMTVKRLRDLEANRHGYFTYLEHVSADRSVEIARIFDRLVKLAS